MDFELYKYQVTTEIVNYNNIFLISDLHFGVRGNSLEWLQNQQRFFNDFYIPYLKKNKKDDDILWILGDWFDGRQYLDIFIMNASIDIMIELSKIIPVYFLVGNHDCAKKYDTDINSLAAFKFIPNIKIYEEPIIISNNKNKILILPWIGNALEEENYLKANKVDYIFAHTDIQGFCYDNGHVINDGVNFKDIEAKKIISGHIHKRQENANIIYLGSPYHTKRSDIGNDKGIYYLNPQENKLFFTLNNLSSVFQRVRLEYLMELTLEQVNKLLENNYTDIIVPDKYIHLFNLTKFIELLQTCKYKKIETIGERINIDGSFNEIIDGEQIKDILTLLEMNINDLQQKEMHEKLKILNKKYYELANKSNEI